MCTPPDKVMDRAATTTDKALPASTAESSFSGFTQGNLSCKDFFDGLIERSDSKSTECASYKHAALEGLRPDIREKMVAVDGIDGEASMLRLSTADLRCRAIQAELRLAAGVPPPGRDRLSVPAPTPFLPPSHIVPPAPLFQSSSEPFQMQLQQNVDTATRPPPAKPQTYLSKYGKSVIAAWCRVTGCCNICKRPVGPGPAHRRGSCKLVYFSQAHWDQLCEEFEATGTIQVRDRNTNPGFEIANDNTRAAMKRPTVMNTRPMRGGEQMRSRNEQLLNQSPQQDQNGDAVAPANSKASLKTPNPNFPSIYNAQVTSPTGKKKKQHAGAKGKREDYHDWSRESHFPFHAQSPSRIEMGDQEGQYHAKKKKNKKKQQKKKNRDWIRPELGTHSSLREIQQVKNEGQDKTVW